MEKKIQILILILLISLLFIINYSFFDKEIKKFFSDSELGIVERVIDGDTIVINGTSVRLLGVNSPEQGEVGYAEGKEFLEMIILNKTVELRFGKEKYDKYDRKLAYIFYEEKNVNLEIVNEGFANVYILDDRKYEKELKNAWRNCVEKSVNLCEKSVNECSDCIELKEFDNENEIVIFYNQCEFDCSLDGWEIKDQGRKRFVFEEFILGKGKEVRVEVGEGIDGNSVLFWRNEYYVWTDTGDTLFLRDEEGKLVLWKGY